MDGLQEADAKSKLENKNISFGNWNLIEYYVKKAAVSATWPFT